MVPNGEGHRSTGHRHRHGEPVAVGREARHQLPHRDRRGHRHGRDAAGSRRRPGGRRDGSQHDGTRVAPAGCGRRLDRPGCGRAGDHRPHPAGPRSAEALQERFGAGPAVEHDQRGLPGSPQHRPRGDLGPQRRLPPEGGRRGQQRHRRHGGGQGHGHPAPDHTAAGALARRRQHHPGGTGPHGQVGQAELAQRQPGTPAGHGPDPPHPEVGRDVEQAGGGAAHDPGDQARGEAPDHDRAGQGRGQQVGRQRGHGQPAEDGDEDRRHAELGGGRDAESAGQRAGSGQCRGQGRGRQDDAGRCGHREPEAHGAHQQGVDQQQARDREGQEAQPRRLAACAGSDGGQSGHGRGAQHRGLEAGHEGEERDHRQRHGQPGTQAQATEQRAGQGEHEGHVLAGHGQQVGETGPPEVVGDGRGLVPVVPHHDAGEQRTVLRPQARRSRDQRAPEPVGQPGRCRSRRPPVDRVDHDDGHHVALGEPMGPRRRVLHPTPDPESFPGQPLGHDRGGVEAGLVAPPIVADVGPQAPAGRFGVRHERDHRLQRPGWRGRQTLPGTGAQRRGQQRGAQAGEPGPAQGEGQHGQDGAVERRRPGREVGAQGGGHRQRDGPAVAHPAATRSRSSASFTSPMPRTSTSSSTERNPPLASR